MTRVYATIAATAKNNREEGVKRYTLDHAAAAADVSSRRRTASAARAIPRQHRIDAENRSRVSADLAPVRLSAVGHHAPGALHAGHPARSVPAQSRTSRIDCRLHVDAQ